MCHRFVGLTITFLQNIRGRLFDRKTMGPYGVDCTVAEQRVMEVGRGGNNTKVISVSSCGPMLSFVIDYKP
jgi:hypothetical protein